MVLFSLLEAIIEEFLSLFGFVLFAFCLQKVSVSKSNSLKVNLTIV